MKLKSRLLENIVSLFVLQGANYALPLLIVPHLVRTLGPENFGRAALAQAIALYFVVLTDYGFNLSATKKVVKAKGNPDELSSLFINVVSAKACLAAASLVAMALFATFVDALDKDYQLMAAAYVAVLGSSLFPVWLLQGLQKMRAVAVITIISRMIVTILIFTTIQHADDFRKAVAIQATGSLIAAFLGLAMVPKIVKLRFLAPSFRSIVAELRDGWHVFLATAGGALYTGSGVVFLALVAPPAVVGHYAAAEKLIKAVQGLISPISQAVYPHVASLLLSSKEDAMRFVRKLLKFQSGGMLAITVLLFALADPMTTLLFGSDYSESSTIVRIMSVVPFLVAINNVLGAQVLVQLGARKLLSLSIMVPALLHIALLYPVASIAGAVGVALIAVWSELLVAALRFFGIKRLHPEVALSLWGRQSGTNKHESCE
ncbi:flippase [Stenotrophomonas bentonitica]|uniref:flippase n=1 Tax=Stenotrophomonas bentonitica TaxID=1450134 RepID=UPI0031BA3B53